MICARKRETVHHALAPRRLAGGSRGLAGARCEKSLLDDDLGDRGILLEESHELVGHDRADDAVYFAVAELRLRLALELRLRNLDADDDGQSLAHVVASQVVLLLDELVVRAILVDRRSERATEAGEMSAALDGVDVVAVGLLKRRVAVGVLEGDFGLDHAGRSLFRALEVDDWREWLLVLVEILDELVYAAIVVESLFVMRLALIVAEVNRDAPVEERELAKTRAENLPLERAAGEDRVVWVEMNPE